MPESSGARKEFAFANAVRVLDGQNARVDAIDTKAGILLAADGVLAGFLVTVDSLLLKGPACLATVVVLGVFASAVAALGAFWPRTYQTAPVARRVAEMAAKEPTAEDDGIGWTFIGNVLESVDHNKRVLGQKVWTLRFAGAALVVALLLLSIGLVWGINA